VTKVQKFLQSSLYRDRPEEIKLAERDAYTFEQLSDNAMKTFYPEAYEMRTRDLKKSESHKVEL